MGGEGGGGTVALMSETGRGYIERGWGKGEGAC